MVNKAIVGILVLIVLTSLGVGVLIGTQLGGGGSAPAADADGGDESSNGGGSDETTTAPTNGTATNATATNETATNATATQTVTPTATATQTVTQTATPTATPTRTAIPPERFDTKQIEAEIIEEINRGRKDRDLTAFDTGTTTWRELTQMARTHSEAMAADERVSFASGEYANAEERYKGANLYSQCKYKDPDGGYIVYPDNEFQAVGETVAGRVDTSQSQTLINENESAVATTIVDDWFASSTYKRPLRNEGTELIGVGVSITDDGRVYASAAICS